MNCKKNQGARNLMVHVGKRKSDIRQRHWQISSKEIGKHQAKKLGYIREKNQGTSSNRDTLGKQIRKHQAKKSGNIRQRNRETSGKESRNFSSSGKLGLGGAVAGK